jgi:signal transduction histidine kinase
VTTGDTQRSAQGGRRAVPLRAYLAALVALFVVAAGAGVVFGRVQADRDARRSARQDAGFGARLGARELSTGLQSLTSTVAGSAANPTLGKVFAQPKLCTLTFSTSGALSTGHLDILRPDGSLVCSSLKRSPAQPDYRGAVWLARALQGPLQLAPMRDARSGKQAVLVAAPVPSLGLVIAVYYLDQLGPALASSYGGPRRLEFLVTDATGRTALGRSVDSTRWVARPLAGTPFAAAAGGVERPDVDGKARLYGSAKVKGAGWTVYAGADRAAALAATRSLNRRELTIILAGLLLAMLAAAVVHRRIARPIQRLSRAVRDAAPDGVPQPVAVSGPAEVVKLAERFNGLVADVHRELGQRERAEAEARESGEAYRVLFNDSPLPKWVHDTETRAFLEVNDAMIAASGYTREELLAMTVEDLGGMPDADGSAVVRRRRDGDSIELRLTSHTLAFRGREACFVIAEDVTERARLRRQLQQSQRLESLGQLAGGVAHDFNNLLAVILGYAAFIDEQVAGAGDEWERTRHDVGEIRKAGERATRLTHQLLAFARREVVRPQVLDLTGVVLEMEELLRRTIGEHVTLATTLAPDLWPIMADYGQLEQVLVNLAVNARDAMPDGGTLSLDTENIDADADYVAARTGLSPGRYVRLRVSDTGTGMEPEVAARAFEPFFTTKPKGKGTGLGLATIYGIVTQAGGHVQIYSEPGLGTTFTVLLPTTESPIPAAPEPARQWRPGGGETILVVEDEEAMLEVARRILVRNGYEVLAARSGADAVKLAAEHRGAIDLLLTDVVMPQMLGKEVAARITPLRPGLRVLYMSGYAQAVIGPMGDLAGGQDIIDKPFSEPALLERVRAVLNP